MDYGDIVLFLTWIRILHAQINFLEVIFIATISRCLGSFGLLKFIQCVDLDSSGSSSESSGICCIRNRLLSAQFVRMKAWAAIALTLKIRSVFLPCIVSAQNLIKRIQVRKASIFDAHAI